MNNLVLVGTDTDAGKTTFALLFLHRYASKYAYWKPLETGDSDTARLRRLIPSARVYEPLRHYAEPVAPLLASRRTGIPLPSIEQIIQARPPTEESLLIETFGGPLSPLTETALQIELIRAWNSPVILIGPSRIGAIGRILAAYEAVGGVPLLAVVLIGKPDPFAAEQIERYAKVPVFSLQPPEDSQWTSESLQRVVPEQHGVLEAIDRCFEDAVGRRMQWSRQIQQADRACVWHPYTPLLEAVEQVPVVAAEREFLYTADGRQLIDAISSWWTILHGHCHPPLVRALRQAAATLDHTVFAGSTHPWAVELAEAMLRSVPWPAGGRVFFSDNGSTAVEAALKMAVQHWHLRGQRRSTFICFEHSYHGDTVGAMSVSRDPVYFGMYAALLFEAIQVPLQPDALADVLRQQGGTIAGVIIEPLVQGAGGMRMHPPQLLRALWEVCRSQDVLFIVDEVMTACRTGRLWAFEQAGIVPDLICTAKTLTGGMLPLAATLVAPHVVEPFLQGGRAHMFFHGHSYTANPLACAVAIANWHLLQQNQWRLEAQRIESFWAAHLPLWRKHPHVRDVRWCGTIGVVELDLPGGYLSDQVPRWRQRALELGVLWRPLGPVLYCLPPLGISSKSLERVLDAFEACLALV